MELETVVEEDESCSSEKSIEARLSISNPKRSGQNGERRTCEEASRVACCIHSVTPKQPHAVHNQSDALSQEGDRGYRKPSPPSTSRCCGRENEHSRSSDEENGMNDLGSSSSSKSNQVCVMNCNEVVQVDESDGSSPHGSFRSDDGGGDRALEAVGAPGTFGEIKVNNSSDVHFGNKIYTAPITVVNQVGGDDPDLVVDSGSFKDPFIPKSMNLKLWRELTRRGRRLTVHRVAALVASVVAITIISAVATVLIRLYPFGGEEELPSDIFINESWFYTRQDWYASPSRGHVLLKLPVEYVIIEHSGCDIKPEESLVGPCYSPQECMIDAQTIQADHMMKRNWDDIGYNYLIGGDGGVYVGRGANLKGAHAQNFNSVSIGIAFIGDFNVVKPTASQLKHAQILIEEAVKRNKVKQNYKLRGHYQMSGRSNSPGIHLIEEIKKWPHWAEEQRFEKNGSPGARNCQKHILVVILVLHAARRAVFDSK